MAVTRQSFGRSVLSALNVPVTDQNLRIMVGWQEAEGGAGPQFGVADNTANYNPLNTKKIEPGSTDSGGGIQSYVNWQQGLEATVATLTQSNMAPIKQMLSTGNASAQVAVETIVGSHWGTGSNFVPSMISSAPVFSNDGGDPIQTVVGGGVFGLGGTGNSSNVKLDSLWTVGDSSNPDQDYWTTINQYAQDAQWYCLQVDTRIPIPTSTGWTTIGRLLPGDQVFGSNGRPTRVVRVTPTYHDRECFRIGFKDGSSIVADASHLWETSSLYKDAAASEQVDRSRWRGLRTTEQIAAQVTRNGYAAYNHHIRLGGALDTEPAELPINPYIFGYWLGDGSARESVFCVGSEDRDAFVAEVAEAGLVIARNYQHSDTTVTDFHISTGARGEMLARLRSLDVIKNKHIPAVYLRASIEQRTALLQGLMDSDGSVGRRCCFSNVNERLARDVLELVRSLGIRAHWAVRQGGWQVRFPRGHVSTASECFTVNFAPVVHVEAFRLERKLTRYRDYLESRKIAGHSGHHTIVSVERVASAPVKCIEVDTDDHLFLAGDGMIPTHNCFSDGETLFVADGYQMMGQRPQQVIVLTDPRVVSANAVYDNTSFDSTTTLMKKANIVRRAALAKIESPTEITVTLICDIDRFRAGDTVYLKMFGPADGVWLISDATRSLFSPTQQLTLSQAMQPINALSGIAVGPAYETGKQASQPGSGTVITKMISEATTINDKHLPYVWGGGHSQAGTPSVGEPGGNGYNGVSVGFDCSGVTAAVLAAGGLWKEGSPVGGDASIPAALVAKGLAVRGMGEPGNPPECTLFNLPGVHIFLRLNGQVFGTSDGGGTPTSGGGSGGAWLTNGPDTSPGSGYIPYHIRQSVLGQLPSSVSGVGD